MPALTWTVLYFTVIMFAMMGYVLYQFHQALGLKVRISFARSSSNPATRAAIAQADPMAEAVASKVATGELDAAIDIADEQRRQYPEDLAIQERYQTLLLAAGRTERALGHGQAYLNLLLRLGRAEQALDLLKRLRGVDAAFLPVRPDAIPPLADAAFRRRDANTTVALVRGFDKRHLMAPPVPGDQQRARDEAAGMGHVSHATLDVELLLQEFVSDPDRQENDRRRLDVIEVEQELVEEANAPAAVEGHVHVHQAGDRARGAEAYAQ